MGKFEINPTEKGFTFHLKAANGEIIAVSELYNSKEACANGIESVKTNAPIAPIEDQTIEGFESLSAPKFEVYIDKAGEPRFRLLAANGQNIAASQGYTAKESCLKGIASVKENAPGAEVVELEA